MNTYHLVIAKYKEDINWVSKLTNENIFIYDKSGQINENKKQYNNYTYRKNIGREVETFLYHIIKFYNNLPDYILFLQGNPFDHMTNINSDNFQENITMLIQSNPKETYSLFTNDYYEPHYRYAGIKTPEYFNYFFNTIPPCSVFGAGCQYIIPKQIILKRTRQFYMHLHAMTIHGDTVTSKEAHHNNNAFSTKSINGWTLERILKTIFSTIPNNPILDQKRYLVTGGAGFIGSNLLKQLSINNTVTVVDNLSTGNMTNISAHDNIHFVHGDITNKDFFSHFEFFDGIFHLAAMSKVLPSLGDPKMIHFCNTQNVIGTINVLDYALEHNPPIKVVYSASSTYYGNNPIPNVETQLPDCQTPYALSKYIGELYCEQYSRHFNVPTVRLRYFMVFGPNEPNTGSYAVVSGIFLKRKSENLPLMIHGDGSQTRDFVHVEDIAKANILAMKSNLYNETINIGTGTMVSIKELANMISPNQIHTEKRKVDLEATLCDTTKCESLLGWKPTKLIRDYINSPCN